MIASVIGSMLAGSCLGFSLGFGVVHFTNNSDVPGAIVVGAAIGMGFGALLRGSQ